MVRILIATAIFSSIMAFPAATALSETNGTESARRICYHGEFALGSRMQGMDPEQPEWLPTSWCYTSDDKGNVKFTAVGKSNSDVSGSFATFYEPANGRIAVGPLEAPDVVFEGGDFAAEALRTRRMDPLLLAEYLRGDRPSLKDGIHRLPQGEHEQAFEVAVRGGRVSEARGTVAVPLRGLVPIVYRWDWEQDSGTPDGLEVILDGGPIFRGKVEVDTVPLSFASWVPDDTPRAPAALWPSRVSMRLEEIMPGVHLMVGARTGFHHLVVETEAGLVVADAPAGWVELHQLPPGELVPGLGISGLSEQFVDVLHQSFPGAKIRGVALTHHHDDHAGGARAFAAEDAAIYAPEGVADFLQRALSREEMPTDRATDRTTKIPVMGVSSPARLEDAERPVELIPMDGTPHAHHMLGVWLPRQKVFFQSDLHVANTQEPEPPAARAAGECWFAAWAKENLPEDAQVHSSHTRRVTSRTQLDAWFESDTCKRALPS